MRYLMTLMLLAACNSSSVVEDIPDAGPVAIRWAGTYTIEYTSTTADACQEFWRHRRIEDERVTLDVESTLEPGIVRLTFRTLNEQGPGMVAPDGVMTTTIVGEYYDAAIDSLYTETFTLSVTPMMRADGTVYHFVGTATLAEEWTSGYEMPSWTCVYAVESYRNN